MSAGQAFADPFFNSSEPGCDGSDPNVLFCDDFEDGTWAETDGMGVRGGQTITSNATTYAPNDGWAMDVWYPTQGSMGQGFPSVQANTGPNYGQCGGMGAAGTNCAAMTGPRLFNQAMMGMHGLFPQGSNYREIYQRWYFYVAPGFKWGHEKMMTFNPCCNSAGIFLGDIMSYFGSGMPQYMAQAEGQWRLQNIIPADAATNPDYGSHVDNGQTLRWFVMKPGNWYALQIHIKMDGGVLEVWMDNCGPSGTGCTGQPTKRINYTGVNFGSSPGIGTLWFESWGNPLSSGESRLDQIKVSKVGPIPFSGQSNTGDRTPPVAPSNLRVQ